MNYMDFDPYLIRERNQQMLREVHTLRLEDQLRENRSGRARWFATLARAATRPLLRGVGLAR